MSLKLKWIHGFSHPDFEDIPSFFFARLGKVNRSCATVTKTQTFLTIAGVAGVLLFDPRLFLSPKKFVHIYLMRFRVENFDFILKISTKCIAEYVFLVFLFFLFTLFHTTLNKMTAIQGSNSHTFPAAYPSPKYSKLSQLAFFHITSAAGLLLHMPRKYRTERNANQFLQNFLAIQIKQSKLPGSKEASQFRERRRRKQHL